MILAITGGTGFVGSHLIDLAVAEGHEVRALARRAQPERAGVTWMAGDLLSLGALVEGADAVIHVAGVVNAPSREAFVTGNVEGTRSMLDAALSAGVARFVHVSSLAAREPAISDYGWSKAEAERRVEGSGLDWAIVRPPAIFGARDTEMLELFRLARHPLMPLPPAGGRLSVIAVEDLVRLLLALAAGGPNHVTVEPDDGRAGGWDHRDLARAIGDAVGRKVTPLPMPPMLLGLGALADRAIRGRRAKLTPDRVRYFCHPDWVAHARPSPAIWQPQLDTRTALADTAAWYREQRML